VNHYCTYFDRGYLAQGVAMWRSLARNDPNARLTVLALDDFAATVLRILADATLRIVELRELLLADLALADVQASRSRAEFIFALTPCLVRYEFITRSEIQQLAYLDADLFFFSQVQPIWDELGGHSVLIVPHRYPSWHDDSKYYGRFNVGVVGFRRDDSSRACIEWWREQCLASTTLDSDGERYGDQKYLDAWPQRFSGVVESSHSGVNVAPWNWAGHRFEVDHGGVRVDDSPLVVYHFAQFKRISATWFDSGQLEYGIMPRALRNRIYGEYWTALQSAEAEIQRVRPDFTISRRGWKTTFGAWHLALLRIFWGQFWWRAGSSWFAGRLGLGRWAGHVMGRYRQWQRRA
jgi:hypothetical protein